MKRYTAEELNGVFDRIAPPTGLVLPSAAVATPAPRTGPAMCVYLRYSEIVPGTPNRESLYWKALRQTPLRGAIGVLASINSILSEHRSVDPEVHRVLNERFFTPELLTKLAGHKVDRPGFTGVFTRIGCLQLIRHLLLYGKGAVSLTGKSEKDLGALALLSNDFLPLDRVQNPAQPTTLDLLLSFLPVWDVYNPRDLAYALSRTFSILTEILPGNDPEVRRLTTKLGMNISATMVGRLPLNDFIAAVFGLFAYGRQLKGPEHATFDVRRVFSKVGFPPGILRKLVQDRALSTRGLGKALRGGKPHTRKRFNEELAGRAFLTESLNIFRQAPLLKMDANRMLILDLDFLVELLTSGVYWTIFDNLPPNKRETFRQLWGRLFEIYAVDLLKEFYPETCGMLHPDVQYKTGQIDALLDLGNVVGVFEIKSSLLTEVAKRATNRAAFVADYERKFVRNAKGAPKALLQLAEACKAVEDGRVRTATRPRRIYPVCVSDEPGVESFFFNTYSNEIFQKEMAPGSCIRPVTMMSINELEEALPYVSGNDFDWAELFESRFIGNSVCTFSVHQAIYDLLRAKGLRPRRNQAIRKSFDEVWKIIGSRCKPPKA